MTPVLVGIGAALATLVLAWLVAGGVRLVRRARWQRTQDRRLARMRRADREHRDAGQEEPAAGHDPEQILVEARRKADALVSDAEQNAREIVAAATLARARLEQEIVQERKLADEKRGELSALLLGLLSEVQRASGDGAANVRTLHEARETRTGRAESAE